MLTATLAPDCSGAFSNVYKARDRKTGLKVAIKVVRKYELNSNQVSSLSLFYPLLCGSLATVGSLAHHSPPSVLPPSYPASTDVSSSSPPSPLRLVHRCRLPLLSFFSSLTPHC